MQPVEQGGSVIAEPPEELAPEEKAADSIPDPIVREPLVAPGEASTPRDLPPSIQTAELEGRIIDAISTIFDPEIPVNIYELGLIYDLSITADNCVRVEMTLTSPACPVAGSLPGEVEQKVRDVDDVQDVTLELVWTRRGRPTG